MNLTTDEKSRLMRMIVSDDKEGILEKLSKEIEEKEKIVRGCISEDYVNIIDKCANLWRISKVLFNIADTTTELSISMTDAISQHIDISHQIEENDKVGERLEILVREFESILEFVEAANRCEDVPGEDIESLQHYYKLPNDVLLMEGKLHDFRKYAFFPSVSQMCTRARRVLVELIMKDTDLWVCDTCNDTGNIGTEINAFLGSEERSFLIFDGLGYLRRRVIPKRFLCILYASRKIGVDFVIIERINLKRKEFIEGIMRESGFSVCGVSGFMLWSYHLSMLDPKFEFYDNVVLDLLVKNRIKFGVKYFEPLKNVLMILGKLIRHLGVDSEKLDQVIISTAIDYFESFGKEDMDFDCHDADSLKIPLMRLIDECNEFVSNVSQFSNELDELLAKKIDDRLCTLLESSHEDVHRFFKSKAVVTCIVDHAASKNNFYKNIVFKCLERAEQMNSMFIDSAVALRIERIDASFEWAFKTHDLGADLLKVLFEVNDASFPELFSMEVKRKLVLHIKAKFLDILSKTNNKSSADIGMLEGHACSFYGCLRKSEPAVSDVFTPVIDLCKRKDSTTLQHR